MVTMVVLVATEKITDLDTGVNIYSHQSNTGNWGRVPGCRYRRRWVGGGVGVNGVRLRVQVTYR